MAGEEKAVEKVADKVTLQTAEILQDAGKKTTEVVKDQATKYSDAYSTMHHVLDDWIRAFWERLPYLIMGLIIIIVFWLLSKLFKFFVFKVFGQRVKSKQNLVLILRRLGSTFILFFGWLIAFVVMIPDFSPTQLISALGIGSVAIGFAFKDIFQNLLSGILILLSEPFRIGDVIAINGLEGTVEDIQIRATFLRSFDGRRFVIPNATVYTGNITVNTAYSDRRCEFVVGIGYDDDIEQAQKIVRDILEQDRNVLEKRKYTVEVIELADFSVNIRVRWWVNTNIITITESTSQIQIEVKKAFDKAGIDIPYPIQNLQIEKANLGATDEVKSL